MPWLGLTPSLARLFDARTASAWTREAVAVADASRDADGRLPVATRVAIPAGLSRRLLQHCPRQRRAVAARGAVACTRDPGATHQGHRDLAHELGVGEVSLLPVSNAEEFGRVNDRLDSDELGLAARVEKATSRRHRHLLLLGMHVGVAAALTDMSGGKLQNPLRQYIGRHATLAGVPPAGWEPAARAGEGTTPEQQAAAYQAALTALDMAVAELGPVR